MVRRSLKRKFPPYLKTKYLLKRYGWIQPANIIMKESLKEFSEEKKPVKVQLCLQQLNYTFSKKVIKITTNLQLIYCLYISAVNIGRISQLCETVYCNLLTILMGKKRVDNKDMTWNKYRQEYNHTSEKQNIYTFVCIYIKMYFQENCFSTIAFLWSFVLIYPTYYWFSRYVHRLFVLHNTIYIVSEMLLKIHLWFESKSMKINKLLTFVFSGPLFSKTLDVRTFIFKLDLCFEISITAKINTGKLYKEYKTHTKKYSLFRHHVLKQ